MIKWLRERRNEKSTWFAILMFLGSLATMSVVSVATVTSAFVNAALGALAGATTKKDLNNISALKFNGLNSRFFKSRIYV